MTITYSFKESKYNNFDYFLTIYNSLIYLSNRIQSLTQVSRQRIWGSRFFRFRGARLIKNLAKQKKVFAMYKFAKKWGEGLRKTAIVKPVTYNKGACYRSLVKLCVGHWSQWSLCLLVELLCFFFHNKTRICNVIFLPIQLEVKYMPS